MTKIITRRLKEEKDGIEGYIAHPERTDKGPAILMIHQHSGLTGYLKPRPTTLPNSGYTAVVRNLYHMLGYPAEQHIDKGTEIQNKTADPDFVRVIDRGWRYCLRAAMSTARASVSSVTAWAGGSAFTSRPRRRGCAPSLLIIRRCATNSPPRFARAIPATRRAKSSVRR
jgi:hypothetical protein